MRVFLSFMALITIDASLVMALGVMAGELSVADAAILWVGGWIIAGIAPLGEYLIDIRNSLRDTKR